MRNDRDDILGRVHRIQDYTKNGQSAMMLLDDLPGVHTLRFGYCVAMFQGYFQPTAFGVFDEFQRFLFGITAGHAAGKFRYFRIPAILVGHEQDGIGQG